MMLSRHNVKQSEARPAALICLAIMPPDSSYSAIGAQRIRNELGGNLKKAAGYEKKYAELVSKFVDFYNSSKSTAYPSEDHRFLSTVWGNLAFSARLSKDIRGSLCYSLGANDWDPFAISMLYLDVAKKLQIKTEISVSDKEIYVLAGKHCIDPYGGRIRPLSDLGDPPNLTVSSDSDVELLIACPNGKTAFFQLLKDSKQ